MKARLSYLRIAPRKARLVADMVRGKTVEEAEALLRFAPKRAALPILKLVKQAVANAKNTGLSGDNLFISKIMVDEGPKLKRWMPRARGQASAIQKKTSHIILQLAERATKKKSFKVEAQETAPKKEKKAVLTKPRFRPEAEMAMPKKEVGGKKIFTRRKSV